MEKACGRSYSHWDARAWPHLEQSFSSADSAASPGKGNGLRAIPDSDSSQVQLTSRERLPSASSSSSSRSPGSDSGRRDTLPTRPRTMSRLESRENCFPATSIPRIRRRMAAIRTIDMFSRALVAYLLRAESQLKTCGDSCGLTSFVS